jgi:hypothetical protein
MGTALTNPTGANSEGGILDITNLKRDWSVSNLDARYQLSGNMSYALPFGQGKQFLSSAQGAMQKLVGDWQVNSIVTGLTGFPLTVLIGSNQSGTGNASSPDRVSYNPAFTGNPIIGTPQEWFNPAAFMLPPGGTFGNTGRNILRGPGQIDWDFSLFKNFHLTERIGLQFRAEIFNVLNHTNFGFPSDTLSTPGLITRTSTDPRRDQFGLKLTF